MEGIVNNRARPSVKKAWNLTHITKEGADQAATTAHRYHPPRLPPDRSVSAPHMYQRTVPEQKHMATGIWTRANLMLSTMARHRT
jgi:hypothetical protein